MEYIIETNPVGLSAPRSALEALHKLHVNAEKVGDKIIISRKEIVQKLKNKKSIWLNFWRRSRKISILEFTA